MSPMLCVLCDEKLRISFGQLNNHMLITGDNVCQEICLEIGFEKTKALHPCRLSQTVVSCQFFVKRIKSCLANEMFILKYF